MYPSAKALFNSHFFAICQVKTQQGLKQLQSALKRSAEKSDAGDMSSSAAQSTTVASKKNLQETCAANKPTAANGAIKKKKKQKSNTAAPKKKKSTCAATPTAASTKSTTKGAKQASRITTAIRHLMQAYNNSVTHKIYRVVPHSNRRRTAETTLKRLIPIRKATATRQVHYLLSSSVQCHYGASTHVKESRYFLYSAAQSHFGIFHKHRNDGSSMQSQPGGVLCTKRQQGLLHEEVY